MNTTKTPQPERLEELMVDAATQGLAPQDQAELDAALANDPALRKEAEAYELAATAAELALAGSDGEALPASLHNKLVTGATAHLPGVAKTMQLVGTEADKPAAQDQPDAQPAKQPFKWTDGRAFGWYAAAAAMIALCVTLLDPPVETVTVTKTVEVPVVEEVIRIVEVPQVPDPEPTAAEQYAALAGEAGTVTANWGFNADPEGGADERFAQAGGEVIWNADTQTGFMKLTGMPVNDPTVEQYQLWIVDASRDTNVENTNRIDGGVFDVTAAGEVIIPIDAKLMARNAAAFAITLETPGGVVESQGPLQVLALVDAG